MTSQGWEERRPLKRVGECLRCGQCCLKVGFWEPDNPEERDWLYFLSLHGGIEVVKDESVPGWATAEVKARCRMLIEEDEGQFSCALHGTDQKPKVCIEWPYAPEVLIPGCGYHFERIPPEGESDDQEGVPGDPETEEK